MCIPSAYKSIHFPTLRLKGRKFEIPYHVSNMNKEPLLKLNHLISRSYEQGTPIMYLKSSIGNWCLVDL